MGASLGTSPSTARGEVLLMTEYMTMGNLTSLLRNTQIPLSAGSRLRIVREICAGLGIFFFFFLFFFCFCVENSAAG
jgi:serine/threonine protein kinase